MLISLQLNSQICVYKSLITANEYRVIRNLPYSCESLFEFLFPALHPRMHTPFVVNKNIHTCAHAPLHAAFNKVCGNIAIIVLSLSSINIKETIYLLKKFIF